jgi:hypothetical protein
MRVCSRAWGQGLVQARGPHLHEDALRTEAAKSVRAMSAVPAAVEIVPVNRRPSI